LPDRIELSRVTSLGVEAENVVVADNVRWTESKLDWDELRVALEGLGLNVSWTWASDITPEILARSRQPDPALRLLGDPRPPMPLRAPASAAVPRPARRASQEWFAQAAFAGPVPASGKAPQGKRGPKSAKRENTVAAIRHELADKTLTVADLPAMPEKELAHRYGVSRDTARKARNEVLSQLVENSSSTFDK
jgi:hypothetical protein